MQHRLLGGDRRGTLRLAGARPHITALTARVRQKRQLSGVRRTDFDRIGSQRVSQVDVGANEPLVPILS